MIVLRMILGSVLGFIAGTIIVGIAVGMVASMETAKAFAPFGALLGMCAGATWQLLRSDKKPKKP
jgi:F0F1-type ATP synthase assembly protein I